MMMMKQGYYLSNNDINHDSWVCRLFRYNLSKNSMEVWQGTPKEWKPLPLFEMHEGKMRFVGDTAAEALEYLNNLAISSDRNGRGLFGNWTQESYNKSLV